MGSIILILPIFAFCVWLLTTTGLRVFKEALANGRWTRLLVIIAVGIFVGWFFTFRMRYKMGATLRLHSFPVPSLFTYLQDTTWVDSPLPRPMQLLVYVVDFAFGIALAFFPFKVAEFFQQVKAEI
ncbi:MAG: hypothetical protein JWO95_3584 [Verrucomicrobiales bacterium]|nr:hypothetical protein [Verrucomicrobiales bacterium]